MLFSAFAGIFQHALCTALDLIDMNIVINPKRPDPPDTSIADPPLHRVGHPAINSDFLLVIVLVAAAYAEDGDE